MTCYREELHYATQSHGEMIDLTPDLTEVCRRSRIQNGLVHVFAVGSTVAIGTIEFEPGLTRDLPTLLDQIAPPEGNYLHQQTWHDGNGHSHLQATLLGCSFSAPIEAGQPVLGQWQQVFLMECDIRPRRRTVIFTLLE